ncbi:SDR family NAD(P)-dependent oxidoreductase [Porphyrobacter sp. GA68]|uniref:SDR family NAD(P)-dependent oxidoreductase n=1 Tax=Porphyrobacter sp. GA68 TaxID=2883480 RepID=UPI001D196556|nr:SDR family oxidoreductase [Porphyrobacter sp. GA68]
MSYTLENCITAISGGSSGIGRSCAVTLGAAGADVAIFYHRDEDEGEAVAAAVRAHGRRAAAIPCDVTSEPSVEEAFDTVRDQLGVPNILINSAGVNLDEKAVVDMDLATWDSLVRADLTGSFLTSRRFARDLRAAGRTGTIINITSIHSYAMRAGGAAYCAAKGGQRNLTQCMALELAEAGITVNAIAPGMVLTPMNAEAMDDEAYRRSLTQNIPLKRAAEPEEVAQLALFLASPAARYMTGAEVVIDGGLSLLMGQGA